MTLHQHNAREMYKLNQMANFVNTFMEEEHQFLREATRKEDGSGLERKRRQAQIEWEIEQVAAKLRKMVEWTQKKAALVAKLRALTRISDPNAVTEALINTHLDLQLDWYHTFVDPLTGSTTVKVPKKNTVGLKVLKITALKDAIIRYKSLSQEIREDVEERAGGSDTDDDLVSEHEADGGESDGKV